MANPMIDTNLARGRKVIHFQIERLTNKFLRYLHSVTKFSKVSTALAALGVAGCIGNSPSRIAAPSWQPFKMADQAIADLDKDSDGKLSAEELEAAPGLKYCARLLDETYGDGDGLLSRDEIKDRLEEYVEMRVGLTAFTCTVRLDGRPLVGASVRLVPEAFLGDVIQTLEAISKGNGEVEFLTEGISVSVVPLGMYRVEITSLDFQIPAKYNSQTTLGIEVSAMDDPYHQDPAEFYLKTK
jgi:hypothetical protein